MRNRVGDSWVMTVLVAAVAVTASGCRAKAPANTATTPAAPATATATGATAAGSTAAAPGGAKAESPFPGGAPSAAGAAAAGKKPIVRVALLPHPDRIPGIPPMAVPAPQRSPFRAEGLDGLVKGGERPAPTPAPMPLPPKGSATRGLSRMMNELSPLPMPGPLPGMESARIQPFGEENRQAPTQAPAQPVEEKPVPLQLTGIIRGEPTMAIIQGEKAHYIVQEGDLVAGSYRVATISTHKVVLRGENDRAVVLRLGGKHG